MSGNDSAGSRTLAFTLAVVVVASAATAVPGLVLFVQPAAANAPTTVAVAQGTNCYEVAPVGDGSQTVEAFYDYRNPETDPPSTTYSSFGTDEYQEVNVSSMFFYEGANGTSLVVVHEQRGSGEEDGGSTITWDISGLPADWDLAVQDDNYTKPNGEPQDDDFVLRDTSAHIDWKYAESRTDGAAFRGLESDDFDTITVDPAYNEEADHWGEWNRSGAERYRIEGWKLKESGGTTVADLALDRRAFVHTGPCGVEAAPEAVVDGPNSTGTDQPVDLDASGTTDADGDVVGFEWDVDGDGTVDEITTEATLTTTFDTGGETTVRVTAFDEYGNADDATTTVQVTGPNEAPTADLSVQATATVNESVTLDASNSTDDGSIEEYQWDVDGDGVVDETTADATFTTTYNSTGEVQPTVTVVDDANATDTATATLTVERANAPPTANLSAPANATVNESVTLDASGSTDDEGIEEYQWDVDGDGVVDETTADATFTTTYNSTGEVQPTVTVVDAANATATATTTVSVTAQTELSAAIDASSTEVTPGETVTLDASASTPVDAITDYEWDYGDGENGTGETVNHTYDAADTYTVTLTVTGPAGATASTSTTVTVAESSDGGGGGGGGAPPGGNDDSDDSDDSNDSDDSDDSNDSNPPSAPPASGGSTGATGGQTGGTATPEPDPEPRFELGRVNASATDLVAGDEATFSTTVRNTGNASGTKTVEFEVAGEELANESITLAPGENATVSFTHRFADPGNYTVELDTSLETEVQVRAPQPDLSVSDVTASSDAVPTDEPLRLNATVRNDGRAAGSMQLELRLFGEVVDVQNVSVPPGESRTVTFTRQVSAPGTYTAVLAGRNVTVDVWDPNAQQPPTTAEPTTTTTPGFTALAALVALLAVAAAVRRRGR